MKEEKREKSRRNEEKINKIKKINQNDLNAVYKWVKTDVFEPPQPKSAPLASFPPPMEIPWRRPW